MNGGSPRFISLIPFVGSEMGEGFWRERNRPLEQLDGD